MLITGFELAVSPELFWFLTNHKTHFGSRRCTCDTAPRRYLLGTWSSSACLEAPWISRKSCNANVMTTQAARPTNFLSAARAVGWFIPAELRLLVQNETWPEQFHSEREVSGSDDGAAFQSRNVEEKAKGPRRHGCTCFGLAASLTSSGSPWWQCRQLTAVCLFSAITSM